MTSRRQKAEVKGEAQVLGSRYSEPPGCHGDGQREQGDEEATALDEAAKASALEHSDSMRSP